MNNEPVAWTTQYSLDRVKEDGQANMWWVPDLVGDIPLYTHPVKEQGNPVAWRSQSPDGYWSVYQAPVEGAEPLYTGFKELTDEEIKDLAIETNVYLSYEIMNFARAILRKAQEK